MKKIIGLLLVIGLLTGCALNLLTGRKQLNLVKESEMQLMATSTHPSDATRMKKLKQFIPEAMKYYTGRKQLADPVHFEIRSMISY